MINQPIKSANSTLLCCPKCKSTSIAKIIYGLVIPDDELERELQLGRIHLGGCEDEPSAPNLRCNACKHDFRLRRTPKVVRKSS